MKRFYKFLSLLLLSLTGATTAVAQDYAQGDLITTTEEIVGKQVVLYGTCSATFNPGYMSGTGKEQTVTNDCIYEFEAVGSQAEGYDLYYLKQVSTGKYLADFDEFGDDPEPYLEYTADKSQAIELTVLPFDDDVTDTWTTEANGKDCSILTRTSFSTANQDAGTQGFVLCRGEKYSEKIDDYYAGNYIYIVSYMAYAPYPDTNIWRIYNVVESSGLDKLQGYLDKYFENGVDDYPSGTGPGYYEASAVSEAQAVYEEAYALSTQSGISEEEVESMCEKILAAYEKLQNSRIPLSDGYYFAYTDSRYLSTATKNGQDFLWTVDDYTVPSPLDVAAVKQIWQITKAEEEDMYYVKNMYSNKYINGTLISCSSYGVSTDDGKAFILGDQGAVSITLTGTYSPASWIIKNSSGQQLHAKFDNGAVMTWNELGNVNNCFHFAPVSEEDINAVLADVEQAAKNEELQLLYDKALSAYESGTVYTRIHDDESFNQEDALVTDASQFFSTTSDSSEGADWGALTDEDATTYWHSDWHGGAPSGVAHYIGVDLQEAVSGSLQFKFGQRATNRLYPMTVNIYGSNEVDTTNPDEATWTLLKGNVAVDWGTYTDGAYKGVGYASAEFDGSYRYVKFELATNELGTTSGDGTRMALAAFQVYTGITVDEALSGLSQVSEAVRTEMETQLAAAKEELETESATDATIAALQAAYDKFVTELPVPSLIYDAVEEAQTAVTNAVNNSLVGDTMGHYTQDTYDALLAAIENASNYDTTGKTATEINEQVQLVEDAMDAFYASVILPEAGKFYTFRGMSEKINSSLKAFTSYRAQVYSTSNTVDGGIYFTRPDAGGEIADGTAVGNVEFEDTVFATDNAKYVWLVEKAEAGKIVLRNVGTGMYFAPQEGEIRQSATAFEIPVTLGKAGVFVLDAGEDSQVNANSGGNVVTWEDATDQNAWWTFEEIQNNMFSDFTALWAVTPAVYQIMTLPYEADVTQDGTAYTLLGQSADNKLVLAENKDMIPAATPFIFLANEGVENATVYTNADISSGELPTYVLEPVKAGGIQGTLCEEIESVGAGYAYLNNGNVVATNGTTIGVNSGYFDGTHETGVSYTSANPTLDLGSVVINAISDASVVVLPEVVNVYAVNGSLLRKGVKSANATKGLPAGVYVVGGVKMIVK